MIPEFLFSISGVEEVGARFLVHRQMKYLNDENESNSQNRRNDAEMSEMNKIELKEMEQTFVYYLYFHSYVCATGYKLVSDPEFFFPSRKTPFPTN